MSSLAAVLRLMALLLMIVMQPAVAATGPVVSAVRAVPQATGTQLVLQLSEPVTCNLFTLPNPHRVVLDLPELDWRAAGDEVRNQGLVSRVRVGLFKPGTSRVVFDVTSPVRGQQRLERDADGSYQLVIDLEPIPESAFKLGAGKLRLGDLSRSGNLQPASAMTIPPMPRPISKPVVAIDAGHGGIDPGAIGASGIYEKQITLAAAKQLRARLQAGGRYKVFLTRDRDVFVPLRDRVLRARKAGADLFISLHADSIGSPDTRGLSVYTLSEQASDKEAAALAARENKVDLIAGVNLAGVQTPEVVNILIDLAQRETMNLSAYYARSLVKHLEEQVVLLRDTHRFAGFAVLKAPDVPSVLVELGYLSNPTEERLLGDASYRAKLVEAIARATDRFFAYKDTMGRS